MNDFEQELRNALERKQPSAGFAERVIARSQRRSPDWRLWLGAVAAVLLMGVGVSHYHERQEAMRAKRQLLQALEITEEKLALVERKLSEGRLQQ